MSQSKVIGTEELLAKIEKLDEVSQASNLAMALQVGGLVIQNAAKENVKTQGLIETGNLRRSIHMEVMEVGAKQAKIEIGTDAEYAAIHEYGGVIMPRAGKYLAIPVGSYTDSPTKHQDLAVVKTAGGNVVMMDRSGVVQYVLKESVTIPAAPYLRPAMDENQELVQQEAAAAFAKLIMAAIE